MKLKVMAYFNINIFDNTCESVAFNAKLENAEAV